MTTLVRELIIVSAGATVILHWNESSLYVQSHIGNKFRRLLCCELEFCSDKKVEVPLQQVIWAQATQVSLEVIFLSRKQKKEPLSLERIEGRVEGGEGAAPIEWAEALMNAAYTGALVQQFPVYPLNILII
jgi:hypothetical protein